MILPLGLQSVMGRKYEVTTKRGVSVWVLSSSGEIIAMGSTDLSTFYLFYATTEVAMKPRPKGVYRYGCPSHTKVWKIRELIGLVKFWETIRVRKHPVAQFDA